ncbi:MAG: glycosyltransferase family 4 protein [Verrucomicrobia bacterium]|nr:glycosyltransferase family 4 protein [Verrucomicrobiota bacterium]
MTPSPQHLRIQIVLPFVGITGGNLVLLELANRLKRRGHDVWMLFDYPEVPWWKPRGFTRMKLRDWGLRPWVDWFDLQVPVLRCPGLKNDQVPEADAIIVSYWLHAHQVAALSKTKGRKFYYIQAYETDFLTGGMPLENRQAPTAGGERWMDPVACDLTYRLPMKHIVVAAWLGRLMWERFHQPSVRISPPIDFASFPTPEGREFRNPPRCLMQHHTPAVKGVADGVLAFELAAREVPGMTLSLFGPHSKEFATPHRTLGPILPARLHEMYREHDIMIWPSHVEGYGLPPIEAMACQCAVATTNNGGSEEFAFHERTALVSAPKDPTALAANIVRLAKDMALRRRLAQAGCDWVRQHLAWERACRSFECCCVDDSLWQGPNCEALSAKP